MQSDMKYVTFFSNNGEQLIIFPKIIQHSVMAEDVRKSSFGGMTPISAGFIVNGECVGKSESLRLFSRGDNDTALILPLLDLDKYTLEEKSKDIVVLEKPTISKNQAKRKRKKLKC
tara:strand:+ start:315 stop:662 length:348 start_codon:yes stop_codon:yes gene_type:complete